MKREGSNLSDSSALRDLANHLREQAPPVVHQDVNELIPSYALVILEEFDDALIMIGRSGTETFHGAMKQIYGLDKTDIVLKPGAYMSALKAMLDASSDMIEGYILKEVRKKRNISAGSIEDALKMLKESEKVSG